MSKHLKTNSSGTRTSTIRTTRRSLPVKKKKTTTRKK